MSVSSKMSAIANGIRKLLGLSGTMGLDDMANNINTAQTEVDIQNDLISRISGVLNGKAGGIVPQGSLSIGENGTYDVTTFANAQVDVPVGVFPEGTKQIISNGTHDVAQYASAEVNVPVPSGYIKPSGTKTIAENGTHDVTNFASAKVDVPVGVFPEGIKNITENGTHDVTQYASAEVNVPVPSGYIKPSGTMNISDNGTHNVSQYEYANVSVTPQLQEKSVEPNTTEQTVTPDSGYDGLSKVIVSAYNIQRKSGTCISKDEYVDVDVGFQPDIVVIHTHTERSPAAWFDSSDSGDSSDRLVELAFTLNSIIYTINIVRKSNRFSFRLWRKDYYSSADAPDIQLSYTAIKYT